MALPLPAGRSGPPFLSREQETHLFRKMNYLKCRADRLREQLDPDWPNPGDLDEIERLHGKRGGEEPIVERYLRLVVSIAKTRPGLVTTCPNVSATGTRADPGGRLLRFRQGQPVQHLRHLGDPQRSDAERTATRPSPRLPNSLLEESVAAPDHCSEDREREEADNRRRKMVVRWLSRLDDRERRIVTSRYGSAVRPPQTLVQIARELGITRDASVRSRSAQAKLHRFFSREAIEELELEEREESDGDLRLRESRPCSIGFLRMAGTRRREVRGLR